MIPMIYIQFIVKPEKKGKTKKVIVKIKNNKSNIIDFNSYRREDVKV